MPPTVQHLLHGWVGMEVLCTRFFHSPRGLRGAPWGGADRSWRGGAPRLMPAPSHPLISARQYDYDIVVRFCELCTASSTHPSCMSASVHSSATPTNCMSGMGGETLILIASYNLMDLVVYLHVAQGTHYNNKGWYYNSTGNSTCLPMNKTRLVSD